MATRRRVVMVPRSNPSGQAVRATDLRPGDTLVMEDLGRVHVIQGPFRSTRGIRFVDQDGNGVLLRANETVHVVARGNPRRKAARANPAGHDGVDAVAKHVASVLRSSRCLTASARIRETSRGGVEVRGVDVHALVRNSWLANELERYAAQHGYALYVDADSLTLLPRARRNPASRGGLVRHASRPSRARYPRASAAQRAKWEDCIRSVKGRKPSKRSRPGNPWAICSAAISRIAGHKINFHKYAKRRKAARQPKRR